VLVRALVFVIVIVLVFVVGHRRGSVKAQGNWARIHSASSRSRQ
jgi:hypothetical protein